MTIPPCQDIVVDGNALTSPSVEYWGADNPCLNRHVTTADKISMDLVQWVRLGRDIQLRSSREWLGSQQHNDRVKRYMPWLAQWDRFLESIDQTEDGIATNPCYMKLPQGETVTVRGVEDWHLAMIRLDRYLKVDERCLCHQYPPVVLIGTQQQTEKWEPQKWIGSVLQEARLAGLVDGHVQGESIRVRMSHAAAVAEKEEDNMALDQGTSPIEVMAVDAFKGLMYAKGLMEDSAFWHQACRFLRHDPADTQGLITVPGLRLPLRPYQAVDMFKALSRCHDDRFNGSINGSEPGMGKTAETFALQACVALAGMSRDAWERRPDDHKGEAGDCALNHPHGIECYCIRDGFTRKLAQTLRRAPHLIVCPAHLCQHWGQAWSDWLTPTVETRDRRLISDVPLLLLGQYDSQNLSLPPMRMDGRQGAPVPLPELRMDHFRAPLRFEGMLPDQKTMTRRRQEALRASPLKEEKAKADWKAKDYKKHRETPPWFNWRLSEAMERLDVEEEEEGGFEITEMEGKVKLSWPTTTPGAGPKDPIKVARERLVLVCSWHVISTDGLDNVFRITQPVQVNKTAKVANLRLTRCFRPSTMCYDEFVLAKGANTKVMVALRDLCRIRHGDRTDRALVTLLSGTPMPKGPKDLVDVLPLICSDTKVMEQMAEMRTVFDTNVMLRKRKAAREREDRVMGPSTEAAAMAKKSEEEARQIVQLQRQWDTTAPNLCSQFLFQREFGKEFLGGTIPDPRPWVVNYLPEFPALSSRYEGKFDELKANLQELIDKETAKAREARANGAKDSEMGIAKTITNSSQFHQLRVCSVCPTILDLEPMTLFKGKSDAKKEAAGRIPAKLRELQKDRDFCPELRRLEQAVLKTEPGKVRRSLLLTINPLVAQTVAEWLKLRLEGQVDVIEVSTRHGKSAKERSKRLNELGARYRDNATQRVVVVSTFQLMSTGIDGLQFFLNHFIQFGEPWTSSETIQAIRRLHRHGQKADEVWFTRIHGAEASIDHEIYQRNTHKLALIPRGGILAKFM